MPVNKRLPFAWYNTPNRHFATVNDFEELLASLGFQVLDQAFLHDGKDVQWLPSLRSTLAIYRFKKR